MEKVVCQRDEISVVDKLELNGIDKVFILHDLYSIKLKEEIKDRVVKKLREMGE